MNTFLIGRSPIVFASGHLQRPSVSWAVIQGYPNAKTVLEVIWEDKDQTEVVEMLDGYRELGINVILIKVAWRGETHEAAAGALERQEDEFGHLETNASVWMLVQDPQKEDWEVTSFGGEAIGLPEGRTIIRNSECHRHSARYCTRPC